MLYVTLCNPIYFKRIASLNNEYWCIQYIDLNRSTQLWTPPSILSPALNSHTFKHYDLDTQSQLSYLHVPYPPRLPPMPRPHDPTSRVAYIFCLCIHVSRHVIVYSPSLILFHSFYLFSRCIPMSFFTPLCN